METPPISALVGCLLLAACSLSSAQSYESITGDRTEIAWASDAFATNLLSDNETTFGGSPQPITFELGTFREGFDPKLESQANWAANWIALQTASYDAFEDQVISTATLSTNSGGFATGGQAYIWGYTTKDVSAGAEWIVLAASSWKWPSIDSPLPTTFSVSDVTKESEMLMGSVNSTNDGVFHNMQLEAVMILVPETSNALMLSVAGLLLCSRRWR